MEMDISHRDTETQSFRGEEAGMSLCLRGSVGCKVWEGEVSRRGSEAQRFGVEEAMRSLRLRDSVGCDMGEVSHRGTEEYYYW
jgi:hypothetical protein